MAKILDGKIFAKNLRDELKGIVSTLQEEYGNVPGLAVYLLGIIQLAKYMFETKVSKPRNAGCVHMNISWPAP